MMQTHYFLGANTPQGFFSVYDDLFDPATDKALYILKGGPGCGKSSFMRKIAAAAMQRGLDVEFFPCSGDPDSLDAIYLPACRTAYVDGTAPHVIEPKFPAAAEQYINLGQFYNADALQTCKAEIMAANAAYKEVYVSAYQLLAAAGSVYDRIRQTKPDDALLASISKRSRGIISRELRRPVEEPGRLRRCFLSAVTCKGSVSLLDETAAAYDRIYLLDNATGLAPYMLKTLDAAAESQGYGRIQCLDPLAPDQLEHLLIPALSLAFVSARSPESYAGRVYRHIRLDAMAAHNEYHKQMAKLRPVKKLCTALVTSAESELGRAKTLHDSLEAIYNPHVDFAGVYALADRHIATLPEKGA